MSTRRLTIIGVALLAFIMVSVGHAQILTYFLYDDFEDGNYTANPTWTMTSNGNGNGNEDWAIRPDPWDYGWFDDAYNHGSGYMVGSNAFFGFGTADEELSIDFDTDGSGTLKLIYWIYFQEVVGYADYFEVLIDDDQVDLVPDGPYAGVRSVDIEGYNDGGTHNLVMHYYSPSSGMACAFDDVRITNVMPQDTLIVEVSPAPNENNVPTGSDITVQFDVPMNGSTINSGTFRLNSRATGLVDGFIGYNSGDYLATFDPTLDFSPGDVITGILTTGIYSADGDPLQRSYVWSFTAAAPSGSGTFDPQVVYGAGAFLWSVCSADLDNDGDLDLAISRLNTSNRVSVLLNNGDGSFASYSDYVVGTNPWSITAADLDRDGDVDLATANLGSGNVSILMNNGNGTFASQLTYGSGSGPAGITSGDFDGDGDVDLVTGNGAGTVSVLLNNGNGTFAAPWDYGSGVSSNAVCTADLDGDGDLDLIVGRGGMYNDFIAVLLNNGDATFGAYTTYAAGEWPQSVLAADLDNDGDMDIASANWFSNNMSVFINQGSGTFAAHVLYAVGLAPTGIAAGDIDADADLDLVVSNEDSDDISVLLNNGDGTFAGQVSFAGGDRPRGIVVVNLDSDSDLDLAVPNYWSQNVSILLNTNVPPEVISTIPAQNQLNVTPSVNVSVSFTVDMDESTIDNSSFVVNGSLSGLHQGTIGYNEGTITATLDPAEDFDDGEVVSVTLTDDIQSADGTPLESSYCWLFTIGVSGGTGEFVYDAAYTVDINPRSVCSADFNADGANDLACGAVYGLSVLLNNGDGTFTDHVTYISLNEVTSCAAADLDRDGYVDLISSMWGLNNVTVLMNNGDGTFGSQSAYTVAQGPNAVTVLDINGDGNLDLASVSSWMDIDFPYENHAMVSVLMNNGDGTFASYVGYDAGEYSLAIAGADLDNDMDEDLVTTNTWGSAVSVYLNDGDGTLAPRSDFGSGTAPASVTVGDFDADGDLDIATANQSSDNVSVLLNNGDGTFFSHTEYAAGDGAISIHAADMDGDGDIDLAAANQLSDNVTIILNNGDGSFVTETDYWVGDNVLGITGADFDLDGDIDIATANHGPDNVAILMNSFSNLVIDPSYFSFECPEDGPNPEDQQFTLDSDANPIDFEITDDADWLSESVDSGTTPATVTVSANIQGMEPGQYTANITITSENAGNSPQVVEVDLTIIDIPQILSTTPSQNELNVAVSTNISVVFDVDMNQATLNSSTFAVNGRSTGLIDGTISYEDVTGTATFDPAQDLAEGDLITVVLTTGILSSDGYPLSAPYAWSFTAAVDGGTANFSDHVDYAAGDRPWSMFSADFDGDGDLDLATANSSSDNSSIFLNSGDGTFAAHTDYAVGEEPWFVTAADLDGDSDVDLVTANIYSEDISVLMNNGDGSFASQSTYPVGEAPTSVVAADLDGDGDMDLAATNNVSGTISVLKNNGDGTFMPQSQYEAGETPFKLFAGDFDGDADLDLATANYIYSHVTVLLNNGDGSFGSFMPYEVGDTPLSITAADLDADGHLDLAASNCYSQDISILMGNGDGTFAAQVTYPAGECPWSVKASDLDGDGDLDLVTANDFSNDVSVLLNNGDGTFASHVDFAAGEEPYSVFAVDLDGDGDMDLATANYWSNNVSVLINMPACEYLPGDCDHNGVPLELSDVVAMIGMYRGPGDPGYFCDCPPHGDNFTPEADPDGNCVPLELSDVVTEIGAYRGSSTASGCVDCPGQARILPGSDDKPAVVPRLGPKTREAPDNSMR